MAEPRDRLVRDEPLLTPMVIMSSRRSTGGIWQDFLAERRSSGFSMSSSGGRDSFRSPIQSRVRSRDISSSTGRVDGYHGTPGISRVRNVGQRNMYGNPSDVQENPMFSGTSRRRGPRGGRLRNISPLPSWYPRTPLGDITAVANAIERRRTRLREVDSQRDSIPESLESGDQSSSQSISGTPLEQEFFLTTPNLKAAATKAHITPVNHLPKIFLGNCTTDISEFLTPQKKLLNSIDQVEKAVMEEFRKMKRTPSAKKAERHKKVRTLMAMR